MRDDAADGADDRGGRSGAARPRLRGADPGGRGRRIVAVAEPDPARRARFAAEHGLPPERTFPGWREMAARGRPADGVIIATQDAEHAEPAIRFAASAATSCWRSRWRRPRRTRCASWTPSSAKG
ncbi:hypothetical protein ACFQY7_23490 [Actinomadura luteofluorescens]|uniref:hypothetical protein n=1 Tax=Actinomadura luteofluorescens TaxID=46163 RepID=UPI00363693C7